MLEANVGRQYVLQAGREKVQTNSKAHYVQAMYRLVSKQDQLYEEDIARRAVLSSAAPRQHRDSIHHGHSTAFTNDFNAVTNIPRAVAVIWMQLWFVFAECF